MFVLKLQRPSNTHATVELQQKPAAAERSSAAGRSPLQADVVQSNSEATPDHDAFAYFTRLK